jgi:hypothetical protein
MGMGEEEVGDLGGNVLGYRTVVRVELLDCVAEVQRVPTSTVVVYVVAVVVVIVVYVAVLWKYYIVADVLLTVQFVIVAVVKY